MNVFLFLYISISIYLYLSLYIYCISISIYLLHILQFQVFVHISSSISISVTSKTEEPVNYCSLRQSNWNQLRNFSLRISFITDFNTKLKRAFTKKRRPQKRCSGDALQKFGTWQKSMNQMIIISMLKRKKMDDLKD